MSAELWEKVLCKHCDVVGSSHPAAWTTADFIGKVDEATKTDPDRTPHVSARRPFVSFARNGFLRVGGPLDLAIVADAEQAFVDKDESRPLRHRSFVARQNASRAAFPSSTSPPLHGTIGRTWASARLIPSFLTEVCLHGSLVGGSVLDGGPKQA